MISHSPPLARAWRRLAGAHFLACLMLGCAFVALTSCATAGSFKIRSVKIAGTTCLLLRDVAGYYGMKYDFDDDKDVRLTSASSTLVFTVDSRDAMVNTIKVSLSHAVTTWDDKPVVSEVDFRRLLDPILRSKALPRRTVATLVIDAGHGGKDQGAEGDKCLEKDLTLAVADQLATLLRKAGYTVKLTRSKDEYPTLEERVEVAKKEEADLFISIHANSAEDEDVNGIETFLLTPEGTTSTYSDNTKDQATAGNTFDKENARLAYEVQRQLIRSTGQSDRGLKHAEFRVLRDAPCPAVLVEMGFITNSSDEKKMRSADHQRKIAKGLLEGIRSFERAVKKR